MNEGIVGSRRNSLYDSLVTAETESRSEQLRLLAVDADAVRGATNAEAQGEWRGKQESPDIDNFLLKTIDEIGSHPDIVIERVEIENYGYASYRSAFVTFCDPVLRTRVLEQSGSLLGVVGLNVLLCRLAPFACISSPSRIGEGFGTLTSQGEYLTDGHLEWQGLGKKLMRVLRNSKIEPLPPHVLDREIDADLFVDTNLGEPPFRVFDAWFHWSD